MNLWTAASDGDVARVAELLDSGAHGINDADESGYTLLAASPLSRAGRDWACSFRCMHAAASYAHRGLLEMLIQRQADVNARDSDGETPLHVCEDVRSPPCSPFWELLGPGSTGALLRRSRSPSS